MILLVTKDLFFVPTLRAAAEKLGVEVVTVLSLDSPKLMTLAADDISACVLDLSSTPVNRIAAAVATLRARFPHSHQIAFGPHVQELRLNAAKEAGCQPVLTRGQLSGQIDRWMPEWIN